jgi:hypothetical protein
MGYCWTISTHYETLARMWALYCIVVVWAASIPSVWWTLEKQVSVTGAHGLEGFFDVSDDPNLPFDDLVRRAVDKGRRKALVGLHSHPVAVLMSRLRKQVRSGVAARRIVFSWLLDAIYVVPGSSQTVSTAFVPSLCSGDQRW